MQPPPLALIVDHQLRPESREEAYVAAQRAEDLGLRSRVLTVDWGGELPSSQRKMHAARDARYSLLLEACQREGMRHLFTAHHADDQAETFLLRFIHASGLDGLACIPLENRSYVVSHGVRLLRPLLDARKAELMQLCHELGLEYAEDPTNMDPSFQRNRFRHLLLSSPDFDSQIDSDEFPPYVDHENFRDDEYGRDCGGDATPCDVPFILDDILRLQRLCARVSTRQQKEASQLLQRATLHACQSTFLVSSAQWQSTQREGRRSEWNFRQRWIHWPGQLPALSRKLGSISHAILQARPFASSDEVTASIAISHLLQRVSGREYPPGLGDCTKLARRLAGGQLTGGFTGGGCAVQPIPRSKGRYFLVAPQKDQSEILTLIKPAQHGKGHLRYTVNTAETLQAAAG